MPRHRMSPDPALRARRAGKSFTGTAAFVAGAVAVAMIGTGGTYALWNDNRVVPVEVASGTAALTINDVSTYGITGLDFTQLLPGRSVITSTPLTVKNTGIVPLTVTPASASITDPSGTLATQLVVAVSQAASCVLTPVGTTPASFSSIVLQPDQTTTVCVEVQLKATAPASVQGNSASFRIQLDGVQVAS